MVFLNFRLPGMLTVFMKRGTLGDGVKKRNWLFGITVKKGARR